MSQYDNSYIFYLLFLALTHPSVVIGEEEAKED
jgi:hypothetical protein